MTATRRIFVTAILVLTAAAGCNKDTATTPTTTTTTTTTGATPTITDSFTAQVPVRGTVFYPFTVAEFGAVNVTLTSVTGTGVPATVQLRLGLGTITDDACAASSQSLARAGTVAQVTTTLTAGTYCVMVQDVGNLFAPATVAFNVLHP